VEVTLWLKMCLGIKLTRGGPVIVLIVNLIGLTRA
jgi:hypothetical protein